MKRLQLPKNKLARLAINVLFVLVWPVVASLIGMPFIFFVTNNPNWIFIGGLISWIVILLPIALVTRYIWRGRIRPKRRITTSMDD